MGKGIEMESCRILCVDDDIGMLNTIEDVLINAGYAVSLAKSGKQAIELIDELQKRTGAAVIIIEHRLEDVLHRPVDRIILMNEGRIVSDTTPDELLSSENLAGCGVREPLYLTCLKYAGIDVNAAMHPSSLSDLALSDENKEKVREFFIANQKDKKAPKEAPLLYRDWHGVPPAAVRDQ